MRELHQTRSILRLMFDLVSKKKPDTYDDVMFVARRV